MKHFIFILLFTLLCLNLFAQTSGISPAGSFDIRKKIEPPLLEFAEPPSFEDTDGNQAINANENCKIVFKLRNAGKGDALNLHASLSATGNTSGITYTHNTSIQKVEKSGGVQSYELPITSDINTINGSVVFNLEIEEPMGFGTEKVSIQVNTRKFLPPSVKVVDYVIFSEDGATNLELKKTFKLQLLVQNLGQGNAKDVTLNLTLPENVFMTSGDYLIKIDDLAPGEKKSVEYEMIMNSKYAADTLPITAEILESYNRYAENWSQSFKLNQALSQRNIVIQSGAENTVAIVAASLRSDVDKDIPSGLALNSKKYALIIGCEDYAKYQNGLDKEANVEFAANDAQVVAEYAEKTLGYPKDQIYTLIDPTASQIKQNLERLIHGIEIEKGKAEILFYYSGHGLPDVMTQIPYLIPVDVNGNNPQDGISVLDLYSKLAKFPSAKATIVLDACFSGGARNKELVALKGVKIRPRLDSVPGNLVVFSSSSGTESSAVYREKQHGYFTYFLLKSLREYSGTNTFNDFFNDVNYKVSKEVLKIGKTQTPEVLPGAEIGENWKKLTW